jgi:hypothetical protein
LKLSPLVTRQHSGETDREPRRLFARLTRAKIDRFVARAKSACGTSCLLGIPVAELVGDHNVVVDEHTVWKKESDETNGHGATPHICPCYGANAPLQPVC